MSLLTFNNNIMLGIKIFKGFKHSLMPSVIKYMKGRWNYDFEITLTDSCKCTESGAYRVNRLFGVKHGILPMFNDFDSFGWLYIPETNSFMIFAKYKECGVMKETMLMTVEANTMHHYCITYDNVMNNVLYKIDNNMCFSRRATFNDNVYRRVKRTLTPNFNRKHGAPHTITINFEL